MDDKVQKYIKAICSHIKWKNYHLAIKSELQNHINDSISDLTKQGISEEEALNLTLQNMGAPDILGKQLNEAYKPECNKMLIFTVLFSITIFSIFEYFSILKVTGEYLYILKIISSIIVGSLGGFLLFMNDWSSGNKLHRFTTIAFISIAVFCVVFDFVDFSNKAIIINGMLLLFPLLSCCFIDRVKNKKMIGLFFTMFIFTIPIFLSYYLQAFASMIVLSISVWIVLILIIKNNWLDIKRKEFMYVFVSLPYLCVVLYSIISKIDNIQLNMKGFFVKEIIKKSIMFGRGSSELINYNGIIDYPITLMIANYGYIILIAYFLFFTFLIFEIIKIYNRQQNFVARLLIISVMTSLIIEFVFSVLLNLGVPLAKGIAVPFLNFNFGIIIKVIQLGLVEMLDCFGNYIFSNYSDNKLFDIEEGKIIIYYK